MNTERWGRVQIRTDRTRDNTAQIWLYECQECGALVDQMARGRHDLWHVKHAPPS